MRTHRRWIAFVAAAAAACLVAGCSSGSSDSGGSGGGGNSADAAKAVETAKALLDKYSAAPTDLGVTQKISKPVPTGKTIAFLNTGTPTAAVQLSAVQAAAQALGWTIRNVPQGSTPDKVTNAWNSIVRNPPDGVISTSQPVSAFRGQLDELDAKKVPVVDCCSSNDPVSALKLSTAGKGQVVLAASLQAAKMIVDSGGKGSAVFISTPAFPSLVTAQQEFDSYVKANCPSCSTDKVDIAATDIAGNGIPPKIVGFLRSHPDFKYVVAGYDDELIGLPAALSQANLNSVKLIGKIPSATTIPYIESGVEIGSVTFPVQEYMWLCIDALARLMVGDSVDVDDVVLPEQMVTKDNLPAGSTTAPTIPDYQSKFKDLWGVSAS